MKYGKTFNRLKNADKQSAFLREWRQVIKRLREIYREEMYLGQRLKNE